MIKLIALDMDGVILKNRNSWELALSGIYGVGGNRKYSFQSISKHGKKFSVPLGLDIKSHLDQSFDVADVTYDFQRMSDFLSDTGIKSVIISAGVVNFARKVSEMYHIDGYVANDVMEVGRELKFVKNVDPARKDLNLKTYLRKFSVKESETISIGDSIADFSMKKCSSFFIAFNPLDSVLSSMADFTAYNFAEVIRIVEAINDLANGESYGSPLSE
ncbi:hypothetical protein [Thermoplasma sp.]|uniref:HAD family hydrolase n=1 Tax=Thermoplasma sp. TaxID=1973142 RepID=UPI002620996E|nr:hypothetical protein [Thermoplasma sp.]